MRGGESPEKGLLGAHAPGDPPGDRAPGAAGGAGGIEAVDQGDDAGLIDGSPDLGGSDLLALAADTVAGPRRARGRPAGSANKRNMDMVAYLGALGHRDPMVTLSMLQTADTKALAKALGVDTAKGRLAVAQMQRQAASDMLPYFYAKKPQQLELTDDGAMRPLMVIGEMTVNQRVEGSVIGLGNLPAVRPEKANEINGEFMRETSADPAQTESASDTSDLDPPSD